MTLQFPTSFTSSINTFPLPPAVPQNEIRGTAWRQLSVMMAFCPINAFLRLDLIYKVCEDFTVWEYPPSPVEGNSQPFLTWRARLYKSSNLVKRIFSHGNKVVSIQAGRFENVNQFMKCGCFVIRLNNHNGYWI